MSVVTLFQEMLAFHQLVSIKPALVNEFIILYCTFNEFNYVSLIIFKLQFLYILKTSFNSLCMNYYTCILVEDASIMVIQGAR